jgi:hypothetical protein
MGESESVKHFPLGYSLVPSDPSSSLPKFYDSVSHKNRLILQKKWDDKHGNAAATIPGAYAGQSRRSYYKDVPFTREFFKEQMEIHLGLDAQIVQFINETSRFVVIDGFLNEDECNGLIRCGQKAFRKEYPTERLFHSSPDRNFTYSYLRTFDDPVVQRIENRIAAFTGVPVHGRESSLMVTLYGAMKPGHKHFPANNVHIDADVKGDRLVTAVIYLNDMEVGSGGETMFPTLGQAYDLVSTKAPAEGSTDGPQVVFQHPVSQVFDALTLKMVKHKKIDLRIVPTQVCVFELSQSVCLLIWLFDLPVYVEGPHSSEFHRRTGLHDRRCYVSIEST